MVRKNSFNGLSFWRVVVLIIFVSFLVFLTIFRLYKIQVASGEYYKNLAENQYFIRKETLPKRGEVFLKEKDGIFPAAVNKSYPFVFAVPSQIKENRYELAAKLAEILSLSREEVEGKVINEQDSYRVIKKNINADQVRRIKELNVEGIYLDEEIGRFYPGGKLAAQTIGFMSFLGDNFSGVYGVEKYFNDKLSGSPGFSWGEKDAGGRWIFIGKKSETPVRNGDNLFLSIDYPIQFKAELILHNAVKKHQASGGRIIIVNPQDGKIIAMAQEPSFDLNNFSSVENVAYYRNSLISDSFECGSVFKTFTMAAGLDSGEITPKTNYYDNGLVTEAGYEIRNSDLKANGEQTMTNIIEKSLNTGVIFVEKKLGNDRFLHYLENFGFGQTTEIDLPGESKGNISNLKTNRNIEFFTAAFGQGITVTPLQLIMAYSAIANGGELLYPQILDRIEKYDGDVVFFDKKVKRRVISSQAAKETALMLESNVINGHGKLAAVPGYRVAGKTGTAQVADREKGGYLEGATTGSFAGFAPIDNPRFAMLVVIDNPRDVQWAESSAAPVFGELAKFILEYYGVPPTEEFDEDDLINFSNRHQYFNLKDPEEEAKNKGDSSSDIP